MPTKRNIGNIYTIENKYCYLFAINSKMRFIIDVENLEKIIPYHWYVSNNGSDNYYIHAKMDRKWIYLHRFLTDCQPGMFVDHIDRNGLNNKISNLRICTREENSRNHTSRKNSVNGISGVFFSKKDKLWIANIRINGKRKSIGYFKNYDDALCARLRGEKEYYGDFSPQKYLFEKYGI